MQFSSRFTIVAGFCLLAPSTASAGSVRKIWASGSSMPAKSLEEIVQFSGQNNPHVVNINAASYDSASGLATKEKMWTEAGCTFEALEVAWKTPDNEFLQATMAAADIISVGGGNTLFLYDRLVKLGLDRLIQEAISRGAVLAGGSAGGIIGFEGGHSDSMCSTTYKNPPGPLLNPEMSRLQNETWAYIRTPALGLLNGLFCPHYDDLQSNGIPRSEDFAHMMQRHTGESAVGVDHYAALMIDGDDYKVISRRGDECGSKPCHGSVAPDGSFSPTSDGVPGVWKLSVNNDGSQTRVLAPPQGKIQDLLPSTRYIVDSNFLPVARAQNPDDGMPPFSDMSHLDIAAFEYGMPVAADVIV